jgi:hypothetical protein
MPLATPQPVLSDWTYDSPPLQIIPSLQNAKEAAAAVWYRQAIVLMVFDKAVYTKRSLFLTDTIWKKMTSGKKN